MFSIYPPDAVVYALNDETKHYFTHTTLPYSTLYHLPCIARPTLPYTTYPVLPSLLYHLWLLTCIYSKHHNNSNTKICIQFSNLFVYGVIITTVLCT
jgi:hypothetical protein